MKPAELLDFIGVDAIVGFDAETYYDDDYSLKKMATSEYVYDPRFKLHMGAVQWHTDKKADVIQEADFQRWVRDVNWKRTALLGHHAQFDGLILSRHYKARPAFILDTMSMGRAIMPITVGDSLEKMCAALGRVAKKGSDILIDTKGKRELSLAEKNRMARYAGGDIQDTWWLFWKLLPFISPEELHVIDITCRMFTDPIVRINVDLARQVETNEIERKAKLVATLQRSLKRNKLDIGDVPSKKSKKTMMTLAEKLGSSETFARLLENHGVEPPMKVSPAKLKRMGPDDQPKYPDDYVHAFALGDQEFKDLLKHEDKKVRALVEARVAVKSTNMEKKAGKMAFRGAWGPVPIYLRYAGAKTLRWSGSDKINWQNMNRGSDMRRSIEAPPGYVFIVADQAQIEDRLNCWYTGQWNILEAYARGEDVYAVTASGIYKRPIDKDKNPRERFVGKTLRLGGGYQAGGPRIGDMLRLGQFGPPVYVTDSEAEDIKVAYRQDNPYIVAGWKETQSLAISAFIGKQRIEHKHGIVYEGKANGACFIHHLPTGMSIRYDDVKLDKEGQVSYLSEYFEGVKGGIRRERTKLYGGILTENRTQFMARMLLAHQMVEAKLRAPKSWGLRHATTTHDEVLIVVKSRFEDRALDFVKNVMLEAPPWLEGLPFGVDAQSNTFYDKD